MSLPRAQYHCIKCQVKYLTENPGKLVYHCKYNYMHIFLEEAKLKAHESATVCKKYEMGQTFETFTPVEKKPKSNQSSSSRVRENSSNSTLRS